MFGLPLPVNLGNSRLHWAAKHRLKLAYWTHLDTQVTLGINPRAPARPWTRAVADVEVRTIPIMDRDNAYARTKWIIDWLQSRGYITNDRHLHCSTVPVQAARRAECGITLRLREAA